MLKSKRIVAAMTLNRIPKDMRKDILNLQKYHELTRVAAALY